MQTGFFLTSTSYHFFVGGAEELPLCALSDDRVVEIQGEARNVHRAMELVVSHLRKFLVDRSVLALFELNVRYFF